MNDKHYVLNSLALVELLEARDGSESFSNGMETGNECVTKWFFSQPSVLNSRGQNSHLNTSDGRRFASSGFLDFLGVLDKRLLKPRRRFDFRFRGVFSSSSQTAFPAHSNI
jgi:hypothetical protein